MTKEEYVETLYIKGKKVDVGIDDYGQCYYFEFTDDNGELQTVGCGTYNTMYLEEVYSYFDNKGVTISLYGKEYWDDYVARLKKRSAKYADNPKLQKAIEDQIYHAEHDDYGTYDFEQMYKDREHR